MQPAGGPQQAQIIGRFSYKELSVLLPQPPLVCRSFWTCEYFESVARKSPHCFDDLYSGLFIQGPVWQEMSYKTHEQ